MEEKKKFVKPIGNRGQMEAIGHVHGPAMVLAGPGSGKTFVIIHRVQALIEKAGADPGTILVITFTKSAAVEMQTRFLKLTEGKYPEVRFGTFHSVFYQIIRSTELDQNRILITEAEKMNVMKQILRQLQEKYNRSEQREETERLYPTQENIRLCLAEIGRLKNDGAGPEQCKESFPLKEYFQEIYVGYNEMLKELNKLDFDDMIVECERILREKPYLLNQWRNIFRYMLIDEYQDINRLQFSIVQMLALPGNNLFIVGDDDQSIYGFRGSRPEIMLHFKDYYPDAREIFLNINYRCQPQILENACKVIDENKIRFQKQLQAGNKDGNGLVELKAYVTRQSQYEAIVERIRNEGSGIKDAAILFRTNADEAVMAEYLISAGVPFQMKEKLKSFYEDPICLDVLAYLRFAWKGQSREDYYRIMNKPLRYIKRDSAPQPAVTLQQGLKFYNGQPMMQEKIRKLFSHMEMLRRLRPFLAIRYIRKEIRYEEFILKGLSEGEKRQRIHILDELQQRSLPFESCREFLKEVEENMEQMQLQKEKLPSEKGSLKLMTMHASKGLEFDTVFCPDLNEGVLPNRKSILPEEIEEERRMFYVAMTRAKKQLCLSYVTGSKESPMMPSRFLRPIKDLQQEEES